MIIPSSPTCSRRTLLRGLGVAIALPWMESLPLTAGEPTPKTPAGPPVRVLASFTGMGFHSKEWWAKGAGATMELGKVLAPLLPWREKLVFLRGLCNQEAIKTGVIHCMQTGNMLSGAPLDPWKVRTGVSFDQVLAQRLGDRTRLPSLVLGCEEPIPGLQDGHPMLYASHISWSTPVSPTWMETRPAFAFDQLFRTAPTKSDQRVVDVVLNEAKAVQQQLSVADRQRFEEYLTSVHELEARIKRASEAPRTGGWKPASDQPDQPRPKDGVPSDVREYFKQMCDLVVLAFQTDTTRFSTLKLVNDASNRVYPHLGSNRQHHDIAHGEPAETVPLNQFFMEQIAYLAQRMAAVREGERTLLDNTVIMHCSSMLHGNHDCKQLPVILVGGAGGQLAGGRVLDYLGKPNHAMCSLFLRLMDYAGLELPRFGDSDQRLPGL